MKYYLAGPMAGYPEYNWPMFKQVTAYLRSRDYDINCATESGGKPELTYTESLKLSLIHMLQCEGILLLPGWAYSGGAVIEVMLASLLTYRVMEVFPGIEKDTFNLVEKRVSPLLAARILVAQHFPDFKLIPR